MLVCDPVTKRGFCHTCHLQILPQMEEQPLELCLGFILWGTGEVMAWGLSWDRTINWGGHLGGLAWPPGKFYRCFLAAWEAL